MRKDFNVKVTFIESDKLGVLEGLATKVQLETTKRGRSSAARQLCRALNMLGMIDSSHLHYVARGVNYSGVEGLLIVQDANQPATTTNNAEAPHG